MMTFNNNEKDFQEKLQKDTEIPVIVHERINQAYRLIENNTAVQKKAPKDPYHWMKIGGRIAGGAAAVLLIAFVFYMTDPVMAKNIPVVGGLFETLQNNVSFLRVQKRRFSSKGGARTFWESGFSKPVKKSIKDVKRVTLASSDLPRRETTRGTIAYRKNRELGKPSTHD